MKQMQTTEKVIGESHFYIRPFPAFTAANISGDMSALILPMIGGLAPLLADRKDKESVLDIDTEDALPAVTSAFSSLSGDKFERLMRKLLTDHGNISVMAEATGGEVMVMDYDLANEVFCGDVQDMFILCYEVIRLNFKGFFEKIGARFGGLKETIEKMAAPTTQSMEN